MADQLGKHIGGGVHWSAAEQIGQELIRLGSLAVLARLLSPSDFGAVALALIFVGFVTILAEFNVSSAVVQRPSVPQEFLNTAFWLNVLLGLLACSITVVMAEPISRAYGQAELAPIIKVAAIGLLVMPAAGVPYGLLQRRMDFAGIARRNLAGVATGQVVAIAAAWHGFGGMSLILGTLASTLSVAVAGWLGAGWRPGFHVEKAMAREILGFSGTLSVSSFVGYWSRNFDLFVIGSWVGEHALGLYTRAMSLLLLPLRKIAGRVDAVLFPAFASIRDDPARIAGIYLKMTRLVALLTFPLALGMWATAPDLIRILFGPEWGEMEILVRILCPLGAIQSILTLGSSIYRALGRVDVVLRVTLLVTTGTSLSIVAGLITGGLRGVAIAYAIFTLAATPLIYLAAVRRIGLGLLDQIRNLWSVGLSSLIMAAAVLLLQRALDGYHIAMRFPVVVIVGVLLYCGLNHALRVQAQTEALQILKVRFGSILTPSRPSGN